MWRSRLPEVTGHSSVFINKKRLFRSSDDIAISLARSYVSSYYLLVEVEAAEIARELDAKAGKGG
jgi:hypothetical protein